MSYQTINIGATANDHTGDPLRTAFSKINDNFSYMDGILTGTGTLNIAQIAYLQTTLNNIQTQLDGLNGLSGDISAINAMIYTINSTLNIQNTSITDIQALISNLQTQIYTKIGEAPIDGQQYVRKNGHWVIIAASQSIPGIDEVLGVNNTAIDKELHIDNVGATVTTRITPSIINLTNGSNLGAFQSNQLQIQNYSSGLLTRIEADKITLFGGTYQYLKYNPSQNTLFTPTFYLPSKDLTANWTLATTADYTLQAVTTLGNTTNQGIQFQPTLDTGTGSKYVTVANMQVYLTSQNQGTCILTYDKLTWTSYGNAVTLSGLQAAGSNSADFILPTKTPATYTLATTADVFGMSSYNYNTVAIGFSGGNWYLNARGLTSSNQSISITATGSNTTNSWNWDIKVNGYLTTASASATYYPLSNPSGYIPGSVVSSFYLSIANAASTYLTIASASSYYPISNPSNYVSISTVGANFLAISTAASTYLTIASASTNYLTVVSASATYYPSSNPASYISSYGISYYLSPYILESDALLYSCSF